MKSSLTCPLVVCLLLSGCVADGAPVPASGSVEALLEEDVRADLGRVAVRDLGETRLGLDGPLLAARTVPYDWGAVGFSRWGDDGPAPRAQEVDGEIVMVADSPTVRLLLSPDREDLHDVMRHQAGGGATYDGHRGDDGEGVEFAAGGPVEIRGVDEEAGTLLIGVEDRFFDVEAWVDADAVGTIYDPRDVDWEDFRFGDELHLRWDARILDAPDGAVLATVDPNRELPPDYYGSCFFDGSELLERWGDWARVYVARGGVAVDGWVHEDEVVQQRSGCGRCGGVGFGSVLSPSAAVLLEGTPLLDGPEGRVAGTVLMDHHRALGEPNDEDWIPVKIDTLWGEATVWIDGLR